MKIKHNKKRNTAFVYEALVRENTVAILKNDKDRQRKIVSIMRKHFGNNSVLKRDLECYRSLYESQDFDPKTSEKILREAKLQRRMMSSPDLFNAQTDLIHDVNKEISPAVFNNFVPNYKRLATIDQIFSDTTSPKDRIILENQIVLEMQKERPLPQLDQPIDGVIYRTFVNKFNEKYDGELLDEQKELLSRFISSFTDNGLSLKIFLNEEISRLKEVMSAAPEHQDVRKDPEMVEKSRQVLSTLESYAQEGINEKLLTTILKTQKLAKELSTDGHSN